MVFRPLFQIGVKLGVGQGILAGLLLDWTGAGSALGQSAPPREFVSPLAGIEQTALPPGPVAMKTTVTSSTLTQRNFVNKHHIQLPIRLEDSARALIKEIHLYSKETASAAWSLREKAGAMDAAFTTKVSRDGEYWFAIVTLDKLGRQFPSNLANEPPGLIVIVDTERPRIELTNLGVAPAGQLVQCNVSDANLANGSVRLSFQGGDKVFRNLDAIPGQPSIYCVPSQAVFTGLLRVAAEDLAGNQVFSEIHVNQLALAESAAPKSTPSEFAKPPAQTPIPGESSLPRPLPAGVSGGTETLTLPQDPLPGPKAIPIVPMADTKPGLPMPPTIPEETPTSRPNRTTPITPKTGSPSILPAGASAPERFPDPPVVQSVVQQTSYREPAKCQHVKAAKIFLDYQVENIGQSGVGKIEVWLTPDQGKSWKKLAEEAQRQAPLEVHLPGEGLFGITLVTANGRGVLGKAPSTGETPDAWVHVDTTQPTAQIVDTKVSVENKQPTVTIRWTSKDANLADLPVDIFYAVMPQGPWLPIAKGLTAEGETRWTPKAEIGAQAYLRIESRDRAGNVGTSTPTEVLQFEDSSRPRAVIRTITTENVAAPTNPTGPILLPAPTQTPMPLPAPLVVIPPPSVR